MVCLFAVMTPAYGHAYAAESAVKFDETDVLDDLKSMDGFSLVQYPFYESAEPEMRVVDFVEYCYDFRANMRGNYGLYLYVYNPNVQNIVTNSTKNKVQIAVAYDSDPITEKSVALTYEKFDLQFCSVSSGAGVNRLFYKFKVIDHKSADGKTIAERVNSTERRYDISGIELLTEGNHNATEYGVATSYHFTGYAEGYGDGGIGTTLTRGTLETIELDLHSTTYRFPYINENGAGHQNQLDSVYFAIPKEFNEEYGELYRVKCCWDEQKTTPVIVTNNKELYSWASKWVGQRENITDKFGIYDGDISDIVVGMPVTDWGWGYQWKSNGTDGDVGGVLVRDSTPAGYVFLSDKSNVKDTEISSEKMQDWIYGHNYADYLFGDTVDTGRTRGYQEHTFTADEPFDMLSFDATASGWDKFCLNWQAFWTGKSWDFGEGAKTQVEPIRFVTDKDFTGTDAADAQKLYVHTDDFGEFEKFYKANKATKNVFLLRFAVTDYYSNMQTVLTDATWYNPSTWQSGTKDTKSTYMAWETVFLDFDIIELTFKRDTTETIIPVVASPIDVVGGITAPIEKDGIAWGKLILALLALILIVVVLAPILPYVIRAVIWMISLPFKAIAKLCRSGRERRRERKKQRAAEKKAKKDAKKQARIERKEAEKQQRETEQFDAEWEDMLLDEIDWDDPFWSDLDDFNG